MAQPCVDDHSHGYRVDPPQTRPTLNHVREIGDDDMVQVFAVHAGYADGRMRALRRGGDRSSVLADRRTPAVDAMLCQLDAARDAITWLNNTAPAYDIGFVPSPEPHAPGVIVLARHDQTAVTGEEAAALQVYLNCHHEAQGADGPVVVRVATPDDLATARFYSDADQLVYAALTSCPESDSDDGQDAHDFLAEMTVDAMTKAVRSRLRSAYCQDTIVQGVGRDEEIRTADDRPLSPFHEQVVDAVASGFVSGLEASRTGQDSRAGRAFFTPDFAAGFDAGYDYQSRSDHALEVIRVGRAAQG